MRAITGRGTKTGVGGVGAIDGDDDEVLSAAGVVGVFVIRLQEMFILDIQGRNITGAYANDGKFVFAMQCGRKFEPTVCVSRTPPQRFITGEDPRFESLWAIGPSKIPVILALGYLVFARCLSVAQTTR